MQRKSNRKITNDEVGRFSHETSRKNTLWEIPDREPLVPCLCGSDPLIAIFYDPNNRGQETAPTRDHKVAIPIACGSDLLIAIFDDLQNRGLETAHKETAPTRRPHKITMPNVCWSDLPITIFATVRAENPHRMNRCGDAYVVRLQRYRLLSNQG